jgi:hypothetical protein
MKLAGHLNFTGSPEAVRWFLNEQEGSQDTQFLAPRIPNRALPKGGHIMPSLTFTLLINPPGEEQCSYLLANLQNILLFSLIVIS